MDGGEDMGGWSELDGIKRKRQEWGDIIDGANAGIEDGGEMDDGYGGEEGYTGGFDDGTGGYGDGMGGYDDGTGGYDNGVTGGGGDVIGGEYDEGSSSSTSAVPLYSAPITYAVRKTGYYCIGAFDVARICGLTTDAQDGIGIVPVTLVNSRDNIPTPRQATHAEYSGSVLFRNIFEGELPAVEYPKINVNGAPSIARRALITFTSSTCY